jgi:predicted transcriptional regulator
MPKAVDIRKYPGVRLGLLGARKNLGLTQDQVADKAFIARSIIAELELGKRDTSSGTWIRLKEALLVGSVEELWEQYNYNKQKRQFEGSEGTVLREKRE